jgi:hypothetical protein
MKITTILVAALSLAFLAACDRGEPRPKTDANPSASGSSAAPTPTPSSANSGKTERQPVQQQVDPKDKPQQRDFKTDGK